MREDDSPLLLHPRQCMIKYMRTMTESSGAPLTRPRLLMILHHHLPPVHSSHAQLSAFRHHLPNTRLGSRIVDLVKILLSTCILYPFLSTTSAKIWPKFLLYLQGFYPFLCLAPSILLIVHPDYLLCRVLTIPPQTCDAVFLAMNHLHCGVQSFCCCKGC